MVLDIDIVPGAAFVAAPRQSSGLAAAYRLDRPQEPVEDVAPVGEHIEDQPAAGCLLVIPARALRGIELAVEHPPAEIEPHRQDAAEILGLVEFAQFFEAGKKQLVLDDAALAAGALGSAGQAERLVEALAERLLGVDVLAGGERGFDALHPAAGGVGVEIDVDSRVGETGVPVGAPLEAAAASGQRG